MNTMRAMQVSRPGGEFESIEREIPQPMRGQVLVQIKACGVCGGDALTKEGRIPGIQYPRIPGHEIAGIIDRVGEGVTIWQPGDRVGVGFHGSHCFVCGPCRSGDFTNCHNSQSTGIGFDGGYAEYAVIPQEAIARIPEELDFTDAGPLMCAGVTTFNALRNSGATAGDLVAILGIGGLGHLAVQYASKLGFKTVAIARDADKEQLARQLGAEIYIDSTKTNAVTELQRMGGARVIVATATNANAVSEIVNGLGANGRMMLTADVNEPLQIPTHALIFGRKSIQGWYSGHAKDSEEALAFSAMRGIRPIVETFPLDQAQAAYDRMMQGKANLRVVLTM
jgi:D-arabinose 1-dehydrogenase-like Zn-dependent alcohol dehydrogenase